MKWFVRIILIIVLLTLATGFVLKAVDHDKADLVIGIGVIIFALVLMPSFIYQRYRTRKLEDYLLDKEKMNQIIENLKDNGL